MASLGYYLYFLSLIWGQLCVRGKHSRAQQSLKQRKYLAKCFKKPWQHTSYWVTTTGSRPRLYEHQEQGKHPTLFTLFTFRHRITSSLRKADNRLLEYLVKVPKLSYSFPRTCLQRLHFFSPRRQFYCWFIALQQVAAMRDLWSLHTNVVCVCIGQKLLLTVELVKSCDCKKKECVPSFSQLTVHVQKQAGEGYHWLMPHDMRRKLWWPKFGHSSYMSGILWKGLQTTLQYIWPPTNPVLTTSI